MNFSVLASSSKGNCIFAEGGGARLLVDAGTCWRTIKSRLRGFGADPSSIDAILVTHDHADHVSALETAMKERPVPVFATAGTVEAVCETVREASVWPWTVIGTGEPFSVGAFSVLPFSVPHDAGDPVGYTLECEGVKLGIATDLGEPTAAARLALSGCDALALEFNHERNMLMDSSRPWRLKQRISGRSGHLSNAQAAELLSEVASPRLRKLVPLHLSAECNTPEAAMAAARDVLNERGLSPAVLVPPVFPTPLVSVP